MNGPHRRGDRRPLPRDVDGALERELRAPVPAPDLTADVMARLGYARCSADESRRHRRMRRLRSAGLVLVAALMVSTGIQVYRVGPEGRQPVGPTIPSALQHDLERQHDAIDTTIRLFRDLSPARPVSSEVAPEAIAPVRWL